jgi:hypothetical protein
LDGADWRIDSGPAQKQAGQREAVYQE